MPANIVPFSKHVTDLTWREFKYIAGLSKFQILIIHCIHALRTCSQHLLKHLAAQGVLIVENPISKDKYVFIYVEIDIKCLVQSVEIDIATLGSVTF